MWTSEDESEWLGEIAIVIDLPKCRGRISSHKLQCQLSNCFPPIQSTSPKDWYSQRISKFSSNTPIPTSPMPAMRLHLFTALLALFTTSLAHNIQLGAHQRECFHEVLHRDDKMTVTFQVGDREFGGAGIWRLTSGCVTFPPPLSRVSSELESACSRAQTCKGIAKL